MGITITNGSSDITIKWNDINEDTISKASITAVKAAKKGTDSPIASKKKWYVIIDTGGSTTSNNRSDIPLEYDKVTSPVTESAQALRNLLLFYKNSIANKAQDFVATASQTDFVVSYFPITEDSIIVFVNVNPIPSFSNRYLKLINPPIGHLTSLFVPFSSDILITFMLFSFQLFLCFYI